jgi:hypothetical protein
LSNCPNQKSCLIDRIGIYLITQLHENPDQVWKLRYVFRPKDAEKHILEFRIFNPSKAEQEGCSVIDYDSLDVHPDLILFAGFLDKKSGSMTVYKILEKVA